MAKTKQKNAASASQRREQVRQQRQQRLNAGQNTHTQSRNRRGRKPTARTNPWLIIGAIVVVIAIVIGVFVYLANQPASTTSKGSDAVFKSLTTIDPSELATVGTGSAQNLMKAVPAGTPALKGPSGKPQFFYLGAEYCPYCAAQRWGMIVALSRFGTLSQLNQLTSSEDSIPTYTFLGSTYTSKYIDFVSVESQDNQNNPLQTPTASQMQLVNTYDAPPYTTDQNKGAIPFIDIGNQFVSSGSYYSPTVLQGLSYEDIGNQLRDANSQVAQGILGTANYLTAAICTATGNQPASVCTADPIPSIQQSLPKASVGPGGPQLGAINYSPDMNVRRQN
jgi:thiol-disulfide isomerase/thioredoxin